MSPPPDPRRPGPGPETTDRARLVARVAEALAPLPSGASVVLACSGGPDSTALAYLATEAREDLTGVVAHVRHGLRDDAADARMAATHAAWLGLPLRVEAVRVAPGAGGMEAAARDARHAALERIADEIDAHAVLLGHTADDQAETVLLRLARGTGVDGLAGMRPVAGRRHRPLLGLRRAELARFLALEGLPFVEDPSNRDPAVRRSVVRHTVLPALGEVAPDPVGAIARLAALASADADLLADQAARAPVPVRRVGPAIAVDLVALTAQPAPLADRLLRALVREVTGGPPPDAAALARMRALPAGAGLDLPGDARASAGGGTLALAPRELPRAEPRPVPVADGAAPARVVWPPAGIAVGVRVPGVADEQGQLSLDLAAAWRPPEVEVDPALLPPGAAPARAVLALPAAPRGWRLRHRRPGDRLAGAAGTRRLQDLLVDAGVPRPMRELWPVVVDADDRPVWLPGVAADAEVLAGGRQAPAALLAVEPSPAG